jgi:Domain of unknown function (DUF4347)/Bacterial Ig domain/Cadherin-like domain/SdrD B-like domain/Bacterial Ig-like domain
MSDNGSSWFSRKRASASRSKESKAKKPRARRSGIMVLEPRMMYDGAGHATATHHHHHDGAGDPGHMFAAENKLAQTPNVQTPNVQAPPPPSITTVVTQPVNGGTVEVQGTGKAGETIKLYADGNTTTVVGTGKVGADGTFDITTSASFADGAHTFTATESNKHHTSAASSAANVGANVATWVRNPNEIVFIDQQVPDYQALVAGVNPGTEVVLISANSDGVQQIADFLSSNPDPNLTKIDIVGHGQAGELTVGSTNLTDANLAGDKQALATIGQALVPGGEIALYGCEVAQGPVGQQFIADLAADAGGVRVAASTQNIGTLQGTNATFENWSLDVASSGPIDTSTPFTTAALASYQGLLANTTVTGSSITTTLTVDADGDGGISPGDTVTSQITITNTTGTAASGTAVSVSPTGLTAVPNSVEITSIAVNDTYTTVGNTPLTVNAANGLLANDIDFNGDALTIGFVASPVIGGTVVLNSDGSFTFTPTTGFSGAASFTYVSHDAAGNSDQAATVTINVSAPTWYVSTTGSDTTGTGTSANPFATIGKAVSTAAADAAGGNGVNNTISVAAGSYSGTGITLASGEKLIGAGSGSTTFTESSAITLNSGNTISGIGISESGTGAGIIDDGSTIGTLTMSDIAVTTGSGTGISLHHGGVVDITGTTNTISSTSGTALDIENTNIGSPGVTFKSISSGAGANDGIVLSNTGASGGLTVTGDGSTASSGGTIAGKTGTTGGTTNGIGIYLNNTVDVSIAYMQLDNLAYDGIYGQLVTNFSMDHTVVNGANGSAVGEGSVIFGSGQYTGQTVQNGVTGVASITNSTISGGWYDNLDVFNWSGLLNITLNNDTFGDNNTTHGNQNVYIDPAGIAVINATVTNSRWTGVASGSNFFFDVESTSSTGSNLSFTGNTVSDNLGGAGGDGGSGIFEAIASSVAGSTSTFDIENNAFSGANGSAVIICNDEVGSTTTATLNLTFSGNTIGAAAGTHNASTTDGFGSAGGIGLWVEFNGGTMNAMVANNYIYEFATNGIEFQGGLATTGNEAGALNATVIGNTIENPSTAAAQKGALQVGIYVEPGPNDGGAITNSYAFNLTIGGSTTSEKNTISVPQSAINAFNADDIELTQDGDTHSPFAINLTAETGTAGVLSAYSGPGSDSGGQVETFLGSNNSTPGNTGGYFALAVTNNGYGGGLPTATAPTTGPTFGTPIVSGIATEGDVLSASALGTSSAYQWQEAFANGEWIDISGANFPNFMLTEAQVGATLRVVETSVYSGGLIDTVASAATATVADHLTVTAPSITGTDTVGQVLTASTPTANNSDATLSYQWELNSGSGFVAISGATGQTFRLVTADAGDTVEVVVTATDPHGGNVSATSAAVGTIAAFTAPSLSSLALGTLPGNDAVTVTWKGTVNAQSNGLIVNPTYADSISGSNFATVNGNSAVTLDGLTLGGEIFNDANNSGLLVAGDTGIAGVSVSVFAQGGTTALETTTTNASGVYDFTGLAAGNYFVQINASNFSSGGVLANYANSSSGRDATPNDYLGNRSYGLALSNGVVRTNAITIAYDAPHPSGATTYPGDDTTNTLDVGMLQNPVVAGAGNTVNFYQGGAAAAVDSGLTVSDPAGANITGATVTISSGFTAGDTLTFNGGSNTETFTDGSKITATQSGGVLTLTTASGNATAADYQKALDSVTYNSAGDPTVGGTDHVRTLSYQVTDTNSAISSPVVSTLDVFALPIVSIGAFTAPTVTTSSGAVVADPNVSVSDFNGTTLTGATVTISGGAQAGDTLGINGLSSGTINNGANGTITYSFSGSTLTLTGTDTVADYTAALKLVQFDAVNPNGGTRTLTWTASDVAGGKTNNSTPVTTNVNVVFGPVVNAGAPSVTFVGGSTTAVTLDSGITVSDSESTTLTQATVTIAAGLQPGDVLSFNNGTTTETFADNDTITAGYNSTTGVLTLQGTATVADYQLALSQVQFGFNSGVGGTAVDPTAGGTDLSRGITWQVTDGINPSTSPTTTLNVTHTAPTATASGTVAYETGGAEVAIDSAATVSDPDSGNDLSSATVKIAAGFAGGDVLAATTGGTAITAAYDAGTGTLTLSGKDTVANYQQVLDSITFKTTSSTAGNRTINWTVTDGSSSNGSSAAAISTVNVELGPQVTAGGTVSFTGGSTAVVTLDPTLSLTDQASANLQSATVTIAPANFQAGDVLSFNNGTNTEHFGDGGTINATYAGGVLSLNGPASVADYQTALRQVQFSFNGSVNSGTNVDPTGGGTDTTRAIGWTVSDAAVTSNSGSSTLNVVHTAPTVTAGGTVNFELGSTTPVTLDGAAVVGDLDSGGNLNSATVSIGAGRAAGDTLLINGIPNGSLDGGKITYAFDGTNLKLNGADSLAAYQAALDSITFSTTDTTSPTRAITWSVTDGSSSNGSSAAATSTVALQPGPHVIAGSVQTFTEGSGAVTLDNSLNVTDPASTTLTGATVSIGNFFSGDTLNFTNQNNITGSYNAATGVLTLSGVDTVADYQAALQSISYGSTAADPSNGGADQGRTISWAVSDAVGNSNTATSRVNVLGVDQAPTETVPTAAYSATEGVSLSLKGTGLSVGDVDNDGGIETATLSVGEGTLTVTAGNSGATVTNSGTSTVTISGTITQIDALLGATGTSTIGYVDNSAHPGASTALTLSIDDNGHTGTGGAKTTTATATIDITAVDQAPVATATSYTVTENNTLTVPAAAGVLSVDSDPNGDALTAALVNNVAHGLLTLNSDGSFTYTPTPGYSGPDSFTYKASDGHLQSGTVTVTLNVATSGSSAAAGQVYITTTGSDVVGDTSVKSANPNGTNLTTIFADSSVDGSGHDQPIQSPTDIVIDTADNLYFMLATPTGGSAVEVLTGHLNSSAAPTVAYADPDTGGGITSISIDPTTHTLYVAQYSSYTGLASNNGIFSFSYNTSTGVLGNKAQLVSYSAAYSGDAGQPGAVAGTEVGNLSSTVANGFLYFDAVTYYTSTGTYQLDSLNLATGAVTALTPANAFNVTYYYVGNTFVATGGTQIGTIQIDPTLNKVYFEAYTDTVTPVTYHITETGNELYSVGTSGGTQQAVAALPLSAGGFAIDTSTGNFLFTNSSTQTIDIYSSNANGTSLTASSSFSLGLAPYNAADPNSGAGQGFPYDYPTSVFVVPGQQPPTVSITSTGYDATEQVALSLKNTGLSIGDPGGTGTSETLTLSVGEGVLDVTAGTSGAHVTGNDSSSVTITGTVAQIDALLNTDATSTITYTDGSNTPSTHTTLALSVADGGGLTASDTAPIFITAVNDAPVATVSLTHNVAADGTALSLKNDGLSVSDVDGGSGVETATLSVSEGVLNVTAGSSGASVSGSGTSSVTISGTTAQIDALLDTDASSTVSYLDSSATPAASTTLTLSIDDNGHTGTGGAHTTTTTGTIDNQAAPVITTSGSTVTYDQGGSAVIVDSGTPGIAITDSASTLASATVGIGNFQAGDVLGFAASDLNGNKVVVNGTTTNITESYNSATGQLTLTGSDSLADYQAALAEVQISSTAATPSITPRTVTFTVNDGTASSNSASDTVDVVAQPVVTAGAAVTFDGGGSAVTLDSGLTLNDRSSATLTDATVTIANPISGDTLMIAGATSGTGTIVGAGGTITYTFNGTSLSLTGLDTVADYQAALRSISYGFNPANGDPTSGTRTIDWTVSNTVNGNTVSSATATSTLNTVHVAPVLTAGTPSVTSTGGGSAVVLDSGITVSDVDSGNSLSSATVTISNFVSGDTLSFTNNGTEGDITSVTSTSGQLILTSAGAATLAQWNAALESITYSFSPSNGDPTHGGADTSRSISWQVTDGASSNSASNTGVTALSLVHEAPVLTAGTPSVTFNGGGSAVVLDSGITVSDVDSGDSLSSATVTISGFVSGDTLSFTNNGTEGDITTATSATGQLTLTSAGAATLAQWNAALEAITYSFSPSNGDPTAGGGDTSRSISWQVTDGSTSHGSSNTGVTALSVEHVAPSVTAGADIGYAVGGSAVPLDATLAVHVVDSAGDLTSATVSIGPGFSAGDMLNFTNGGGITGSYNSSTGVLTLSSVGPLAASAYQTALDSITFSTTNSTIGPRTIDWQVNDGSSSNGLSAVANSTVTVSVAPAVTAGATETFNGGDSPVTLDPSFAITQGSSPTLASATVSIDGPGFAAGIDTLGFTTNAVLTGINEATPDHYTLTFADNSSITAIYDPTSGKLALNGTDSVADYQAALQAVTYGAGNNDPTNGGADTSRTIEWSVTDSTLASNTASSTLTTVHVAPTVTPSGATADYSVGTAAVAVDGGLTVSDPDSGDILKTATVTIGSGFVSGDDVLAFNNGSTSETFGIYTINANYTNGVLTLSGPATVADYKAALDSVTFVTSATSAGSRTIDWTVTDNASTSVQATSTVDVVLGPRITSVVGQPLNHETVELQGTGVTVGDTINLYADGGATIVGTGTVLAGGTFDITTSVSFADGIHTFTATETGSPVTSPGFTVDVDPTAPVISAVVGQPVNNGHVTLEVTGEAGETVNLYADGNTGTIIGSGVVGGAIGTQGTVDITTTATYAEGVHSFTATETDSAPLTSAMSSAFSVNVDPIAPAITTLVGQPVNGQTVELQGTGQAGDIVDIFADGNTLAIVGSGVVDGTGHFDITTTVTFPDGVHTFSAAETNVATSLTSPVSTPAFPVNVDPNAPINLAVAGQPVNGQDVTVTGTGETAGDIITVYNGAALLGTTTVGSGGTFSFTTSTPFADGVYTFAVTETDTQHLTSATSALTVDVDPNAPVNLAVTGQPVNLQTVTVTGTGETTGDTITIYNGATMLGTTTVGVGGTFSFTTGTTFPDGIYHFTATETDAANLTSAASPLTVDVDPTVPAITALVGQPRVNGQTVELQGTGEVGDTVNLYADGGTTIVGSGIVDGSGHFDITTTAGFADGAHSFTATETDAVGLSSAATPAFPVPVEAVAPINLAQKGTSTNGGTIEITGIGDAIGDTITIYNGTTEVGSGKVGANGAFDIVTSASFADGTYQLTAVNTSADTTETSAKSSPLTVNVDPTAPVITGVASQPVNGGTIELQGTGEAGDIVNIYADGTTTIVGTGTVRSDGTFDIITTATFSGLHTFTATETDNAKLTSAASSPGFPLNFDSPLHTFTDNSAPPTLPNITLAALVDDVSRGPLLPSGDDTGTGSGGGFTFNVVHTDPVLTTASDANVQINLALASLEAPLGGDVVYVEARQADGKPLPDWLKFNPATGTFAGIPPENAVASLAPDQSSDNNIVTGTLQQDFNDGSGRHAPGSSSITIEVLARDSKGNVAVTVFTIDLKPHSAGQHGWNRQPFGVERHASLTPLSPELAAIEAAVRDVTRPVEPFAIHGMAVGHGDAISVGAHETVPAGRAGLTEQLASIGWRSMAAQRNALLASLQQGR